VVRKAAAREKVKESVFGLLVAEAGNQSITICLLSIVVRLQDRDQHSVSEGKFEAVSQQGKVKQSGGSSSKGGRRQVAISIRQVTRAKAVSQAGEGRKV
jgi:hypothetical protein